MLLIKNIKLYAPEELGNKDILISNGKITLIKDEIQAFDESIQVLDGTGKNLIPGLIDNHVHITGGGGEGSFKTRVPEIMLSKLIEAGVTTVVGVLGTDGTTRSVENLVAKTKALTEEGITAYCHTGSYAYPSTTITGAVDKDIVFIEEVLGVKVAISDHRSSSMTNAELARLASLARVAGMESGKPGIVVVHMGDGKRGLGPIKEVLAETDIPVRTMRPTHCNRNPRLLAESLEWAKEGGVIDLTCALPGYPSLAEVVKTAKEGGVPLENITASSDGYGSWSSYDEFGNILEIGASPVDTMHSELKDMVLEEGFELSEALQFFTSNVAKAILKYPQKGTIKVNSDADMLIVDDQLNIESFIAKGEILMENGEILKKGTYE